jgi:hypothetical protein
MNIKLQPPKEEPVDTKPNPDTDCELSVRWEAERISQLNDAEQWKP